MKNETGGVNTRTSRLYHTRTIIHKKFDDGKYYKGKISGYDPINQFYKVQYQDGDQEVFTKEEVKKYYKFCPTIF